MFCVQFLKFVSFKNGASDTFEQHPNNLTVFIFSLVLIIISSRCWNVMSFISVYFLDSVIASESTLVASKITPDKYLKRTRIIIKNVKIFF